MKPLSECRLYTFVDTAYLRGRPAEEVAEQLCEGGTDLIQLRAKDRSREEIREMARAIFPVTERAGVGLVINDHPDIALELGDCFCHLGQEDFFEAGYASRQDVIPAWFPMRLGLSTHAPEEAERGVAAGADYIAIGPVFATGTKPSARPVTLDYVRWAAANVRIPWFAIGGIQPGNLEEVMEAGARRICVVSAILSADNLVETCQSFKNRLLSLPLEN